MSDLTIRQHAEAILSDLDSTKVSYGHGMLRAAEHAQAILDALDKAEHATMVGREHGDYCCDCGTPIRVWHPSWEKHGWSLQDDDIVGRFIPDPVRP